MRWPRPPVKPGVQLIISPLSCAPQHAPAGIVCATYSNDACAAAAAAAAVATAFATAAAAACGAICRSCAAIDGHIGSAVTHVGPAALTDGWHEWHELSDVGMYWKPCGHCCWGWGCPTWC